MPERVNTKALINLLRKNQYKKRLPLITRRLTQLAVIKSYLTFCRFEVTSVNVNEILSVNATFCSTVNKHLAVSMIFNSISKKTFSIQYISITIRITKSPRKQRNKGLCLLNISTNHSLLCNITQGLISLSSLYIDEEIFYSTKRYLGGFG